jgi:hypothetical protein
MAALEREHVAWLREIWAANNDLAERMAALGVTSDLDADTDILFVTIGPPQEALTESVDDWLGLRVDPETLKIVGFEVLHAQAAALRTTGFFFVLGILFMLEKRRTQEPVPLSIYVQLAAGFRILAAAA